MTDLFLSLEQMADLYTVEQDWLFEKSHEKLTAKGNYSLLQIRAR